MSQSGMASGLGATHLDHDDGLSLVSSAFTCSYEFPGALELLAIGRDDACFLIVGEEVDEIRRINIGFVAGRDNTADSNTASQQRHQKARCQHAALEIGRAHV